MTFANFIVLEGQTAVDRKHDINSIFKKEITQYSTHGPHTHAAQKKSWTNSDLRWVQKDIEQVGLIIPTGTT